MYIKYNPLPNKNLYSMNLNAYSFFIIMVYSTKLLLYYLHLYKQTKLVMKKNKIIIIRGYILFVGKWSMLNCL